ncbi:metalloprotease [Epidermidibacterium keratini]|uniref:Metalloprotease n=1 Tax=Epidermidibacterium keratini TaxID=1891644 RepID=A0A7L4YPE9_9ACTN|nr:metalloprotease [Epidermidibacterium keratini]QHC00990.1 metalloprotease [Epidermidibacterium keratini]
MSRILTPRWLAWHTFVLLAFAGCVWGFVWQAGKAQAAGGQWYNYIYAVQWPLFALMGLWGWGRSIWLEFHPPGYDRPALLHDDPDPGRVIHDIRPRAITASPHYDEYADDASDPELDAYNAHLRALNEKAQR